MNQEIQPADVSNEEAEEIKKSDQGVLLIPYPSIVFLWPAWVFSLIAGTILCFTQSEATQIGVTWFFLITLSSNLVVLAFDFPRATSLMLFLFVVAAVLGVALVSINMPDLLPSITGFFKSLHPTASRSFYFLFGAVMTLIYIVVYFTARLDYWEVRPNELLHHHGLLSDLERFSAPHLKASKEINDLFEYMLLGSGRLILDPSSEKRSIVLDNVLFINGKEKAITKMLGALKVSIRED